MINFLFQTDDISCGPTCLKMVIDYMNAGNPTIEEVKTLVGTDDIKGTTLTDMVIGLEHYKIKFDNPTLSNWFEAINYLNYALENGHIVILRTLTKGIKHWIIVTYFDGQKYEIKDPWLGQIDYTKQELIDIWEPREFNCLLILDKPNEPYPLWC